MKDYRKCELDPTLLPGVCVGGRRPSCSTVRACVRVILLLVFVALRSVYDGRSGVSTFWGTIWSQSKNQITPKRRWCARLWPTCCGWCLPFETLTPIPLTFNTAFYSAATWT